MSSIRRRRQIRAFIRIVLITLITLIFQWNGSLVRLENDLDNFRIRYCQHYFPKPTDRLVHLDIDETALEQIGRWPWDRDELAGILEEVRLAGPKVLAMDIILPDSTKPRYDANGNLIDPDAVLADEVRRCGFVLLPTSLTFEAGISPAAIDGKLLPFLSADPELTVDQCRDLLRRKGLDSKNLQDLDKRFLIVREKAIYERLKREMMSGHTEKSELMHLLLPHADPLSARAVDRLFDEVFDRASRDAAFMRFTEAPKPGLPPLLTAVDALTPTVKLNNAAKYGASVDYLPDDVDGIVRMVPLITEFRGRLVPHMGLVVACAMMDVRIDQIRLSSDSIIIPRHDGDDVVIPMTTRDTTAFGQIGMFMNVPMFGKRGGWETMYDFPLHQTRAQHMSMYEPWRAAETRRRIASNEIFADNALIDALNLQNPTAAVAYQKSPLTGDAKQKLIQSTITAIEQITKGISEDSDADKDSKDLQRNLELAVAKIRGVAAQRDALQNQLAEFRADLREKLHDKALFLGGTATGNLDIVPTTLDARCPGVVLHGAIFNAIMTRKMWRVAPRYVTLLIILAFGLITGVLVAGLSPFRALAAVLTLCLGYLAFNGFYLFDYHNLIVGMSGPLMVAILVWSGITVPNFIAEIQERNRITRRFSNYVDPSLVDYVIEHPEQAKFEGEAREMTMGFTDLAGFTTLTESLGTRTIPLLTEYIGLMVPIIRANRGYVSRLMGDGIYFFYNAPGHDPDHAIHAVKTALQMHEALDQMNATLPQRGYPLLQLRAGICSGKVIVGDAGSKEFSDYTAMGDAVNTAARLESANKVFGSRTLVIRRTIELLEGRFLYRPMANLRVAGKTLGVDVFEPLCAIDQITSEKQKLADLSAEVVGKFQAGDFAGCLAAVDRLDEAFPATKFSSLYRDLSMEYLKVPPTDFDGQIILNEK